MTRASDAPVRVGLASLTSDSPVRVEAGQAPGMTLRALRAEDREAFLEILRTSREALDRWAPLHRADEPDGSVFERQLHLTREGERTGRAWRRIGVLGDGRIAGAFNINAIARGLDMSGDVNFWVAAGLTGRGLASEGVRLLVRHATSQLPEGLGLVRLEAGVRRGNLASVRVLEKCGFARLGEERTWLSAGDRWALHDLYAYRV